MTGTTDRNYLYNPIVEVIAPPCPPASRVQYLVLLCCSMDQPPVRAFDSEEDALDFIKHNPPFPSAASDLNSPDVNNAYKVLGADVGGLYGYELYTLTDGKPTERRLYWWSADQKESVWIPPAGWHVTSYSQIESDDEEQDDDVN